MCKRRVFSRRTKLLHIRVVSIYLLIGNTRCFPALQEAVVFGENNPAPEVANLSSARGCFIHEEIQELPLLSDAQTKQFSSPQMRNL